MVLLVLAVAVMHLSLVVTVPATLAVFIFMLAMPLLRGLQTRRMSPALANLLTLFAVACVCGLFLLSLYWLVSRHEEIVG